MILSEELIFSDGQVVAADAVSTNIIDLSATGTPLGAPTALERDIGKGKQVPILVQLDADADDVADTLDVDLEVDADEAFSDPTVVDSSQQITGGLAGDRVSLFFIPELTNERFMRLSYTVTGATVSYTITAAIVAADQTND